MRPYLSLSSLTLLTMGDSLCSEVNELIFPKELL